MSSLLMPLFLHPAKTAAYDKHNIAAILQRSLLLGSLAHKLTNWFLDCFFARDLYNVLMSSSVLPDEILIWAWFFPVTRFNSAEAPLKTLQIATWQS